jgi:hypothetical protein
MKWNRSLVGGIVLGLVTLYYWFGVGHTAFRNMPLFYRFTFRLFPLADILWTIAAAGLLYRGIQQARAKE